MSHQTPENRWIAYRKPQYQAAVRLFCFHYAGGAASVYRGWQETFPPQVEVCPVQLPGRESRLREPPLNRIGPIVLHLGEVLTPLMDLPFAFFGHSMGTILSHELALHLRAKNRPLPAHLFLSARRAPHRPAKTRPIHDLPEEEFKAELRALEGTPEAVLEHPELMELLSPLLRADFAVCETHDPASRPPLEIPISVFGAHSDTEVDREDLEGWKQYTHGEYKLRMVDGNHFFIQHSALPQVQRAILKDLAATTGLALGGGGGVG